VEPACAGLVAAGPGVPVDDVRRREGPGGQGGEDPLDLRDRQGDHSGFCRGFLAGLGGPGCLAAGAGAEQGGGDRADREGGHDQHDVAQDGGVEPGLALVQAEAVLPEFEIFFNWPLLMPVK